MNKSQTAAPWWLEAGPETCSGCEVTVHFEVVIHCVHCDRPFCSLCVAQVNRRREYICKECAGS